MAENSNSRAIDVIGRLPDIAGAALAAQTDHAISVMRLGAMTLDTLSLGDVKGFSPTERQLAQDCAGLALFFTRLQLVDPPAKFTEIESHSQLDPEVLLFAKGCLMHTGRLVLYVGAFTDPTRTKARWISLPTDVKKYFGSSQMKHLDELAALTEEIIEQRKQL